MKIITSKCSSPLSDTDYDWIAYTEEEAGWAGFGATEIDAIIDLLDRASDDCGFSEIDVLTA